MEDPKKKNALSKKNNTKTEEEDDEEEEGEAPEDLIKFPRTRHIFDAGGGVGRDDLVMDDGEAAIWYSCNVSVEEKVDGSNLGISLGPPPDYRIRFQNRSHYVTVESQAQWRQLEQWVNQHPGLHQVLNQDRILFGEWMYARHSIHYTRLPDLFIAFDIYDKKKGRFLSRRCRDRLLEGTGIATVPLIREGVLSREDYEALLSTPSAFYDGPVEGVYIRIDEEDNEGVDIAWEVYGTAHGHENKATSGGRRGGKGKGRGGRGGAKPAPRGRKTAKPAPATSAGRGRGGGGGAGASTSTTSNSKAKEVSKKDETAASTSTSTSSSKSNGTDAGETSEEELEYSYLLARAKIVRADFLESPDVTHWSRQMLVKNIVRY